MIRIIVLASLALRMAQANTGLPTCACLGNPISDAIPKFDCTYDFAPTKKCVSTKNSYNWTTYPGDYGESCKTHKEPGAAGCYDLSEFPPTEKATSEQAAWCPDPWCYIDACNCDLSDKTKSDYFPAELEYSYATCKSSNRYTETESATNTVGNADCAGASSGDSSDAYTLKMGLGLLLASMGTLM